MVTSVNPAGRAPGYPAADTDAQEPEPARRNRAAGGAGAHGQTPPERRPDRPPYPPGTRERGRFMGGRRPPQAPPLPPRPAPAPGPANTAADGARTDPYAMQYFLEQLHPRDRPAFLALVSGQAGRVPGDPAGAAASLARILAAARAGRRDGVTPGAVNNGVSPERYDSYCRFVEAQARQGAAPQAHASPGGRPQAPAHAAPPPPAPSAQPHADAQRREAALAAAHAAYLQALHGMPPLHVPLDPNLYLAQAGLEAANFAASITGAGSAGAGHAGQFPLYPGAGAQAAAAQAYMNAYHHHMGGMSQGSGASPPQAQPAPFAPPAAHFNLDAALATALDGQLQELYQRLGPRMQAPGAGGHVQQFASIANTLDSLLGPALGQGMSASHAHHAPPMQAAHPPQCAQPPHAQQPPHALQGQHAQAGQHPAQAMPPRRGFRHAVMRGLGRVLRELSRR